MLACHPSLSAGCLRLRPIVLAGSGHLGGVRGPALHPCPRRPHRPPRCVRLQRWAAGRVVAARSSGWSLPLTHARWAAAAPRGLFIEKGISFVRLPTAPAESSMSANSSADCAANCANALAWTYRASTNTCTCKEGNGTLAAYARLYDPGATSGIAGGIARVDTGAERMEGACVDGRLGVDGRLEHFGLRPQHTCRAVRSSVWRGGEKV